MTTRSVLVLLAGCASILLAGCVGRPRRAPADAPRAELARLLDSADALRVRSGGLTAAVPGPAVHETLLEVRDPADLAAFAACVEVDWLRRPGQACTPGWPTLELARQGVVLGSLAVLGDGWALRWAEDPSWQSDLVLTPRGARRLRTWLAARGVPDGRAWHERQGPAAPR